MDFYSAYAQGFVRVATCTVPVTVADPNANAAQVLAQARACHDEGVALAVFPELALSGYAVDDLFLQDTLLEAVEAALAEIVAASADLLPVLVVGAPLIHGNRVLNCAVVVHRGEVLGVAPKSYLPTYREFYERRHFAPGDDRRGEWIQLAGQEVPLGPDLLFEAVDVPGLRVHVEVCEDMWVPVPPSAEAALAGATVLANLSGSPITVARAEDRRLLVRSASARCHAAYLYAAAGQGESTTDLSWDGQTMIYECGDLLAESERFPDGPRRSIADVDLDRVRQERIRQGTFDDNRRTLEIGDQALALASGRTGRTFRTVAFELGAPAGDLGLRRHVDRFPFVPDDPDRLALDCYEAYHIQVSGLEQRLRAIGQPKVVIGVSGGLDSTHALIVAARAMDRLGRPRTDIHAFTLPGFATGDTTRSYATRLATSLGVRFEEIDITPAARQLLADLDHPFARGEPAYDITFENVQAGLRTDYLFRLANHRGGIVLGTGDLSELALGWCTYGVGDQMSHYNVNGGVPKTLIQHLIRWVADSGEFGEETNAVLREVVEHEITPELIPHTEGVKPQATEDTVGPYALQDFTLFHVIRRGYPPHKIAFLAWHAWRDAAAGEWPPNFPPERRTAFDLPEIRHWLEVFLRRFFANQFKRSALPNGPKVSAGGTMSPRGDWRMPSDARATAWLADLEENVPGGGAAD
ncbi:MAG TPA: NAD(+) synthase [Nocardioides sp.]|uniref:NAD(+) synthase n=1 Tax=Nocardioides sp. TaxID=35761 RepID=UPI002B8F0A53|nr:NAD(+) synthase [Nocardioides sp.]HQR27020.1 NAD(+) synthase [Nocardioides sp.]